MITTGLIVIDIELYNCVSSLYPHSHPSSSFSCLLQDLDDGDLGGNLSWQPPVDDSLVNPAKINDKQLPVGIGPGMSWLHDESHAQDFSESDTGTLQ